MRPDTNVLCLFRHDPSKERYILLYEDHRRVDALRQIGRWAANPELSLTWYEAAQLAAKARKCNTEKRRATRK